MIWRHKRQEKKNTPLASLFLSLAFFPSFRSDR
jgi:hypothetical protein